MINLKAAHVIAVQSPRWTEATLDQTVKALLEQADQDGDVVAARVKLDAATEYVGVLERRQATLNSRCLGLNARLGDSQRQLRDALAGGEVDDVTDEQLREQGQARALYEGCSRALELLVSELLPAAKNKALAAQVDFWYAQENAIEQVATKRVEAIVEKLAVIADEDCMIEFDAWRVPTVTTLLSEGNQIHDRARQGREQLANIREQGKKG